MTPTTTIHTLLVTSVLAAAGGIAHADGPAATTHLSVEAGPIDFALHGYGLGAAVMPAAAPHWRIGSTAYRLDIPTVVTDLDASNKGWSTTLTFGIDLNVSYALDTSGKGWFFEGLIPYERYAFSHDGMSTEAAYVSVIAGAGYLWLPFGHGLFVRPMLGLDVRVASTGSRSVGGREFADPRVKPLPVLHVGYEF